MKIKLTHDFRGKQTHELFYLAGDVIEIEEALGQELIALGHAVEVVEAKPVQPVIVNDKPAKKDK